MLEKEVVLYDSSFFARKINGHGTRVLHVPHLHAPPRRATGLVMNRGSGDETIVRDSRSIVLNKKYSPLNCRLYMRIRMSRAGVE